jgi:hypothetical protein
VTYHLSDITLSPLPHHFIATLNYKMQNFWQGNPGGKLKEYQPVLFADDKSLPNQRRHRDGIDGRIVSLEPELRKMAALQLLPLRLSEASEDIWAGVPLQCNIFRELQSFAPRLRK